ncbi:MAG: HlyD family efflux transporter periplasmic adaptor subunit [Caldilineaceae bacterium]|nr:HlyD family efflux transporter periplasmic adaptor subunit [Caldilineaceae bacterium]
MQRRQHGRRRRWLWWLVVLASLLALLYWLNSRFLWLPLPWFGMAQSNLSQEVPELPLIQTSPVQRAADFIPDLTVAGKLEFRTIYEIKAPFDETVASVSVANGAFVTATAPLVALNIDQLQEEINSAWLDLTAKRQALADLMQEGSAVAVMEAKAELLTAQEELEKLENGPDAAEVSNAQLAISEAQLAYEELLARNDPNADAVREARYALREAENNVQRAQIAYNAIAWRGDIAASSEASALQSATIAHENAREAYEDAIAPPTELEIQKAQNATTQAQNAYSKLFTSATAAQVEQAKVRVAKAQAALTTIENGPPPLKVQEAEGQVKEALNRLEAARRKLVSASSLRAPVAGQVVKLSAKPGQVVKEGDTLVVVVVPDEFKLTLAVSELYILRIAPEMAVRMTLDVLPGELLTGTVSSIAPPEVQTDSSQSGSGSMPGGSVQFTTYPVTVAVNDSALTQRLRAGMSVQVTFVGSNQVPPNAWLVPASGLEIQPDGTGLIQLMRGDTQTPLTVEVTEQTQGEWVVVISTELQDGDMVVGSTSSFLDMQAGPFMR